MLIKYPKKLRKTIKNFYLISVITSKYANVAQVTHCTDFISPILIIDYGLVTNKWKFKRKTSVFVLNLRNF